MTKSSQLSNVVIDKLTSEEQKKFKKLKKEDVKMLDKMLTA